MEPWLLKNSILYCRKAEREEAMAKRIIEKVAEGLGAFGGIHGLLETLGKVHTVLPEEIKRKLPGFLGFSQVDEAITNGLIRSLKKKDENLEETKEPDIEKQAIIFKFLDEKCKYFERRLFIRTVAEMEVSEAKPPIPGCDRRREFLDVFGTVLLSYNDFDLAYKECVAGFTKKRFALSRKVRDGSKKSS
jgi:hypothetical protein